MSVPHFHILYVTDPAISAEFYVRCLSAEPIEASPSFVMFNLGPGSMLGLWKRSEVLPATEGLGGSELALVMPDQATVVQKHEDWEAGGITIIQAPVNMDFGFTFTAKDPDGHRLRVFSPSQV